MTSPVLDPVVVRCAVPGCTHVAAGTAVDLDDRSTRPVCSSHFAPQSNGLR